MAIQKTKLAEVDRFFCEALWGDQDVSWARVPSEGNSGGIINMWRSSLFSLSYTFSGKGFLGICGVWTETNSPCIVVNIYIYSSCLLADKKQLWANLVMSKLGFGCDLWFLVGDFNAVKSSSERRGSRQYSMNLFKEFIDDMKLIDLPVLGKLFTWFKPDGSAMSRIDRFLLLEGWLTKWSRAALWIGERDVSDHCPIILKGECLNWGPKPFRFNSCWLQHVNFKSFVEESWADLRVVGRNIYCFKEKLKLLKARIKVWNVEVFGNLDTQLKHLVQDLNELDAKASIEILSEEDLSKRRRITNDLWKVQKMKDSLMFQKARSRWLKEGDSNSAYFHSCVNYHRRKNNIVAIQARDSWVEGVDSIKNEVKNHFKALYAAQNRPRPLLEGISFKSLSHDENTWLCAPFTTDEIKETIWSCDGDKSSGPDGFNFTFKKFWTTIKVEISLLIEEFFNNSVLLCGICSSFIALIPKRDNPQRINDYRPISLIGSIHKLIPKMLAARIKKVIGNLISRSQSALVEDRQILDGVLAINEMVDVAKKKRSKLLHFKGGF